MKTLKKEMVIHVSPEKVFLFMDDLSKTGMHMSKNSMMMMGSKLTLEELSPTLKGVGVTYRWHGKVLGMTIDIMEKVTKWKENEVKIWETIGEPKIIILGSYKMQLNLSPIAEGTMVSMQISYTKPNGLFYRILYFFLSRWYCNWCLNNMLNDTKKEFEMVKKEI